MQILRDTEKPLGPDFFDTLAEKLLAYKAVPGLQAACPFVGCIHYDHIAQLRNVRFATGSVVLVLRGEKEMVQEGTTRVSAGDFLFIQAEEQFSCQTTPDSRSSYLAMSFFLPDVLLQSLQKRLLVGGRQGFMPQSWPFLHSHKDLLLKVEAFMDAILRYQDPVLTLLYLEELLYLLYRAGFALFSRSPSLVAKVRMLVEGAPDKKWCARDIAQSLHVSERTLRRHLETAGTNLTTLTRLSRLHAALFLLQVKNKNVSETAQACGFTSASHFASVFKEQFGVSPSAVAAG